MDTEFEITRGQLLMWPFTQGYLYDETQDHFNGVRYHWYKKTLGPNEFSHVWAIMVLAEYEDVMCVGYINNAIILPRLIVPGGLLDGEINKSIEDIFRPINMLLNHAAIFTP